MRVSNVFKHRVRHNLGVFAVLFALVATCLAPTMVGAAQLTQRSAVLSSSAASATGVTYQINFTAVSAAGAIVLDFCSNTPTIGDTCTAPTGFNAASATTTTSGLTLTPTTSKITGTYAITAGQTVSLTLNGITNPSAANPLYIRVLTYDNATDAGNYTSATPGTGVVDQGGIAVSITNNVNVSGTVLETMTFCVSGIDMSVSANQDCAHATSPTLKLGQVVGNTVALSPGAISTGTIYTQISTNAESGAVISLKSDATNCGGLLLTSDTTKCYIKPALTNGVTAGTAAFGVKTGTAVGTVGDTAASGTLEPVAASGYNPSTYVLNYTAGNTAGVTSTYGDPFLDTNSAPINNMNMPITFGASVSNNTPAGNYSANLDMVATGKF